MKQVMGFPQIDRDLVLDLDKAKADDGRRKASGATAAGKVKSMNQTQAKRLGQAVRTARLKKGLSQEQTMQATGLDLAWLSRLESGQYANPDPVRLLRLAEALDFDPARFDKLTGSAVASGLPGVRTYFRSKTPATQEDIDEIERHVRRVLAKYGDLDLGGGEPHASKGTRRDAV